MNAALLIAETAGGWTDWAQTSGVFVLALVLVLSCLIAWMTNLVALPGNWVCVLLIAVYAWLGPENGRAAIGYGAVLTGFALALLGEIIEFVAGAAGAKRAGASRRSTLYSIVGSMAGAIAGAIVGIPIPVIGPVIAAILFGGLGAAAGAMYGEWNDGRSWKENWMIGHATFWGRTFGTMGKVIAGAGIVIVSLVAVLL
ncbi:MAG: DUF456 domain-containing protein [Planctomycetales bacterium]|nr:DUF456 domain-containing protein [Planctomycetales bacterium]